MKLKTNVSLIEEVVYAFSVLFTFGTTWLLKIIIKKAIIESNEQKQRTN